MLTQVSLKMVFAPEVYFYRELKFASPVTMAMRLSVALRLNANICAVRAQLCGGMTLYPLAGNMIPWKAFKESQ